MSTVNEIDGNKVCNNPPVLFQLAQFGIRYNIKGAWRALSLLQKTTLKNCVAAYNFDGVRPVTLYAPLFRQESSKPKSEFDEYDDFVVGDIVTLLSNRQSTLPIWFVDVGADIGMVSAQTIRQVEGLEKIFAFEPNSAAHPYLKAMLENSAVDFEIFDAAVGNQTTNGRLISPPDDPSEHARFFEPHPAGPIQMVAVDTLPSAKGRTVVLKVDVEGHEYEVMEGAREFLSTADNFIVIFEAHPKVISRTGTPPDEIVSYLNSIAPCTLNIAGHPQTKLDLSKSICDQIPNFENGIYNLICSSI